MDCFLLEKAINSLIMGLYHGDEFEYYGFYFQKVMEGDFIRVLRLQIQSQISYLSPLIIKSILQSGIRLKIILSSQIIYSSKMSLESRYDSVLGDMLSVLQQALMRFFTNREVNMAKFQQYFSNFHKKMSQLQQQFHEKQTKFSHHLTKLRQVFATSENAQKFSLEPSVTGTNTINQPMRIVEPSNTINPPITSAYISKNRKKNENTLNIIGQEEDEDILHFERNNPRRSGTAECKRTDRIQGSSSLNTSSRPKTGIYRTKHRYDNNTISYNSQKTAKVRNTGQSLNLDNQQLSQKPQRRDFYKQLEKRGPTGAQIIYQNRIKIPKRNSVSTHRWSFKINKLF